MIRAHDRAPEPDRNGDHGPRRRSCGGRKAAAAGAAMDIPVLQTEAVFLLIRLTKRFYMYSARFRSKGYEV